MGLSIKLQNFKTSNTGEFKFDAIQDGEVSTVSFHFPEEYVPPDDLLAIGISTLLGKKYDRVQLELSLSADVHLDIERLLGAEVECSRTSGPPQPPVGRGVALNFSGGFDSLAAKALLPHNTKLVALDFGGNFSREKIFFEKFAPATIKTDFREKGFAKNTWAFMGIGPILLRDYLGINSYSFGSILEASPYNFTQGLRFQNGANPWFAAAGLNQVNPVLGLTEVGTAMLLLKFAPEHISDSLASLAAPNSEKLARKVMLVGLAKQLTASNSVASKISEADGKGSFLNFGDSFATDFLALYILKKGGENMANILVSNIPSDARSLSQSSTFDFYERLNTDFYNHLPEDLAQRIVSKCLESGIGLYDQNDWAEFAQVRKILGRYHEISGL